MKVASQGRDEFASLTKQMSQWIEHVLGTQYRQYCPGDAWKPSVNLYEDDERYHVAVDLAGVQTDSVDLKVQDRMLVVAGRREAPRPAKVRGSLRMHLMEIDDGHFCRTVEVPDRVDVDAISAEYRNGLLWIQLPKHK